jgi:hypothetical protein
MRSRGDSSAGHGSARIDRWIEHAALTAAEARSNTKEVAIALSSFPQNSPAGLVGPSDRKVR